MGTISTAFSETAGSPMTGPNQALAPGASAALKRN